MSLDQQIPRASILWLIAAQFAVIAPHIQRMPWWVIVIWLLCALWRLAMYRGQAHYPGKVLRMFVVVLAALGVVVSFGSLGGLDISVALLVVAFCLKLIEVRQRRDMFIVFFLAFFVIATAFLFSQSLALSIYQAAAAGLVLTAMIVTQNPRGKTDPTQAVMLAGRLAVQSLPIMLVFFLVFPRIEPLWKVVSTDQGSTTGISDTMSPGDVAKLNRSDKLAFTAKFAGQLPARKDLYWRGMTLSEFDGRTWRSTNTSAGNSNNHEEQPTNPVKDDYLLGEGLRYQLLFPPTGNIWLFTLPVALTGKNPQSQGYTVLEGDDYALYTDKPIDQTAVFRFISYLNTPRSLVADSQSLHEFLQLPPDYNPRTIALARQMRAEVDSDDAFVRSVQRKIATEDYYYTLEPPPLGKHSVDEFLFDERRGFCEHYSSAAVVMLRAAGVPSRVVLGYQGGEFNQISQTLTIRQFDAHAWTEYWLPGRGWVRLDPTASVAPSRISLGMQASLAADDNIQVPIYSPLYYRNLPALKFLRQRAEAMNYHWQRLVVNFDQQQQTSVLETLLGKVTPLRTALLVLAAMLFSGALIGLRMFWQARSPKEPRYMRDYRVFLRRLAKVGVTLQPGEAAGTFVRRAAQALPGYRSQILEIGARFEDVAYIGDSQGEELRQSIRQFRPQISSKK